MVFLLNESLVFPDPSLADEDGLLAIGGDLSPERLILAYRQGIFPWYSQGEPICWYSPHQRFVLRPAEVYLSHTMRQLTQSGKFRVTFDTAFTEVIQQCAKTKRKGQKGTWITAEMSAAYVNLHHAGAAHSVEVWHDDILAGGLYGVETANVFCGESMFSTMPNTSKLALIWLCQNKSYRLIDCQVHTAHLERMGAKFISREEYMEFLKS